MAKYFSKSLQVEWFAINHTHTKKKTGRGNFKYTLLSLVSFLWHPNVHTYHSMIDRNTNSAGPSVQAPVLIILHLPLVFVFLFFSIGVLQWFIAVPLLVIWCPNASIYASFPSFLSNLPSTLPLILSLSLPSLSHVFVHLSSPKVTFPLSQTLQLFLALFWKNWVWIRDERDADWWNKEKENQRRKWGVWKRRALMRLSSRMEECTVLIYCINQ